MIKRVFSILAGLLIMPLALLAQQKATVSGYVTDSRSGEPLIGVAVFNKGTSTGTITGNAGNYSITLAKGTYTIVYSCIGYQEKAVEINLQGNQSISVRLDEASDLLEAAVVSHARADIGVQGTQMSAIDVPINQIKAIPALGGEIDVIKSLQLLPGVQSGSEGQAGLYVRGGGADENLLLMDGVPLYNVNHMFGFFSVFNADALKSVTLYKGSFPARYGGHLSSVVDVRMNDGNMNEIHGSVSIGSISAKVNVEGPLIKGKTTFNISGRRTYSDLMLKPILLYANKDSYNSPDDYTNLNFGYDFYDFNAKITHKLNNDDRISLCYYTGDDETLMGVYNNYKGYDSGMILKSKSALDLAWRWGNSLTSLKWYHEINPLLYLTSGINYTKYRSNIGFDVTNTEGYYNNPLGKPALQVEQNLNLNYLSDVADISADAVFEWRPAPEHDVKFGAQYTYHTFNPGVSSLQIKTSSGGLGDFDQKTESGNDPLFSHEAALYIEDNCSFTSWLKGNMGLRGSLYSVAGKTFFSAEPRLSLRALATQNLSFKASYAEMSQYIHLLNDSNFTMPTDLWVPVTKDIKPMRSRQAAAGAFYELAGYEFSVEGYYKTMDNVLEYKDGASYMGSAAGWEDKVCMGKGWAYGLEFMIQKKIGATTGWIGYTWAKSERLFNKPGQVINNGLPFPAKYDRRHDFTATLTHTFSRNFDLSATFIYASGNCGSLAFDKYYTPNVGGSGSGAGFDMNSYGGLSGYLPGRNNYRLPSYNRLDVGANFYKQKRHGTRIWSWSVYNIYNYKNPFMLVAIDENQYDPSTSSWIRVKSLKKISVFTIIPSVSYIYKF